MSFFLSLLGVLEDVVSLVPRVHLFDVAWRYDLEGVAKAGA